MTKTQQGIPNRVILNAVLNHPGISMVELADVLGISTSMARAVVKQCENLRLLDGNYIDFVDISDPLSCQSGPRLDYTTWHSDAEKRMKRGETSALCAVCRRWRWEDKRCQEFKEDPDPAERSMG